MYIALKHIHLMLIVISVSLFVFRFVLNWKASPLLKKKPLRIAPHAIDTLLLLSGIGLIAATGFVFVPFTEGGAWLTTKLTCVLAYIALGVFAFRGKNRFFQIFSFFGALGWLLMAYNIATTKVPTLFG
uniref:SirB2 family protein n=1 Tax=Thaumasiovibrio occultus TaxID=1891184 RepID=UPI000B35E03E|nr:SirB2 family protein [Thaumasiovibrio occultus]